MSNQNLDSHHEHEAKLQEEWDKSQNNEIVIGLKKGCSLFELLESLPGFKDSFQHELDCLDCADGRVCSGHKFGLAGQGILLNESDLSILENKIKELGIRVTGHDNCGAAGIAYPGPESDRHGYEFTKSLADRTGASYSEVHKENFVCPVHNERCLVLEGTGRFDVANLSGFPGRFISSAAFFGLSEEYQRTEAKALIGIALGDHGFGHRFDQDNPFYLIISAENENSLAITKKWAEAVASEFDGRVQVESFIAPSI